MSNISNDSGLEDSATHSGGAAAAQPVPAEPTTTQLSWFLAEVDEGTVKNGRANGHKRLCVLHSAEVVETDESDKYMTRTVEFRLNGAPLEARLILAADERSLVEAAMVAMNREQLEEEEDAQQMLVQYEEEDDETGKRLVQHIISPLSVDWLSTKPELGGTPLVRTASGSIAHVLYAYEQREYMEKVLLHLKARCFDQVFNDALEVALDPMDDDTWLLVQYSPESDQVIYQIIPYSQTVWRHGNLFKDVVAYMQLPGTETVLQTIVIAFGQSKAEMEAKYEQIRDFALEMQFPMDDELELQLHQAHTTTALFARTNTTIFQRTERRDKTGDHRQLRRTLEEMTEKAQSEAEMIIEAFGMVDNIHRNLQRRQNDGDEPMATSDDS